MPTSATPSFDPQDYTEAELAELWQAWLDNTLSQYLIMMAPPIFPTDRAFDAYVDSAEQWFAKGEAELADHADKQADQQVARARYGFWKD